jgi:outer membrane autotransporter protein
MRALNLATMTALALGFPFAHEARGADSWNLYDGGGSVSLDYVGNPSLDDFYNLRVGIDGGAYADFTMDTGSVGMVATANVFQPAPDAKNLGPGMQTYGTSGLIATGTWYTATQQIYDASGVVVAVAEVPVLQVTQLSCDSAHPNCDTTQTLKMMGVGFAREGTSGDENRKTPEYNAFLNLTHVRLQPGEPLTALPADWHNGYIVTASGVTLGLTSVVTSSDYTYVKLRRDAAHSNAEHTEWEPTPAFITAGATTGEGKILIDTGVGAAYLTTTTAAGITVGPCPLGTGTDCAVPTTHIGVTVPGQLSAMNYEFTVDNSLNPPPANPMVPEGVHVTVDRPDKTFLNTSRHILGGLDYLYDAENGFVGYRWLNAAATQGGVSIMIALRGDFETPDGFTTDMRVSLFGDATLMPQGRAAFDRAIEGSYKLAIDGPGEVVLNATNTYTGDTEIRGGTLSVNGSIQSNAFVHSGAALGGTGELADVHVRAGGTYAPGNSIGTQVVNGNLVFQTGSIFEVEFNAAGASDRAEVYGTIEINGGALQVVLENGNYGPSQTYRVIDNFGNFLVSGAFDEVINPYVFFFATVDYNAGTGDDVEVTLVRSTDFSAVAQTPNERAVAEAVETLPETNPIFAAIQFQATAADARQAFNALSGAAYVTATGVIADQSRYVRQALFGRLTQAGFAGDAAGNALALGTSPDTVASAPAIAPQNSPAGAMALGMGGAPDGDAQPRAALADLVFWTKAYGAWGEVDGNANAAGAKRSLGGVLTGADTRLDHGWRLGLATGYAQSSIGVEALSSSLSVDTTHLAAYAGGPLGPALLRSGAAWGWNSIDASRAVVFPGFFEREQASYGGDVGQLFGELAMPAVWHGVPAEPFAGLAWVHVGTDAFREDGPIAGLTAGATSDDVGYATLGLRLASLVGIEGIEVATRVSAAWQHAFGDLTPEAVLAFAAGGSPFVVGGAPLAQNSALIEAGLGVALSRQGMLEVSYFGQLAADAHDNAVEGRFRWAF